MIVSTVSHFKQTPAVATEIADQLGAGKAAAFDISAGCAGFGYGLTLAKGMIVEGSRRVRAGHRRRAAVAT